MTEQLNNESLFPEHHTPDGTFIVRRWLTIISWEGALATVFITVTGGAFLTGLALLLGANDFEIGLLAAIPFLAQVVQLLSAYLSDRTGRRKTLSVIGSAVGRQVWWILIPILFLIGDWRLEALIGIVIFSNAATMIAAAGWLSWMADLVPAKIRGRYLGIRSAAVAIASLIATIAGGIIIDQFRASGDAGAGFAVIIGAGCLSALVAVMLLNKLPDKPPESIRTEVNWSYFLAPLKDKNFRYLIKVFFAWNLAVGLSAPFFGAHMLVNLKMSFTQISVYSSAYSIIAIVLNKPWGILIDRFGSRPVAAFCAFGIAVIPFLWFFPRPGHLWILAFESVYSGTLWAGFTLAAFNIPIANSPKEGRAIYLAVFSVMTGLAFFASSLMGGVLAESWRNFHWLVGSQTVINYHILFGLSGILRLLAAFLILTFREPMEKGFPVLVQFIGYSILKWLSVGREILPGHRKD